MSFGIIDIYIMHSDRDFYKAYCGNTVVAEITRIDNAYATEYLIHYKHPLDNLDPKLVGDLSLAKATIWTEMYEFVGPKLDSIRDFITFNS